jgi:hypothetical protein
MIPPKDGMLNKAGGPGATQQHFDAVVVPTKELKEKLEVQHIRISNAAWPKATIWPLPLRAPRHHLRMVRTLHKQQPNGHLDLSM